MKRLENKTAVVTGGNSGIGYATAKLFLQEGAQVIITGRDKSKLNEAVKSLGAGAFGILSDAADMKEIAALPEKVKAIIGKLDILFLNAGSYTVAPFELHTETTYDAIMNINSKGVYFTTQKLLPLIQSGGSIIINGSITTNTTMFGISPLIAAKAAVASLSKALANELGTKNIRVNTVSSGAINTPGSMKTISSFLGVETPSTEQLQEFAKNITSGIPLKRIGESDDVAKAVLFFASDESSYVTGA